MNLKDIKIMLIKGQKGDKGADGYDDTELRQMIAQETADREAEIAQMETNYLDYMYPVGSIYMNVDNISPAVLFGGTWEKIEGQFLLASSSTYANGSTGGNATHKLVYEETPYHTHGNTRIDPDGLVSMRDGLFADYGSTSETIYKVVDGYQTYKSAPIMWAGSETKPEITDESDTQAFSIMPPYLAVNVWKRTA